MKLCLDFETSIYNKGSPFDPRNFAVSYSYLWENRVTLHSRYTDLDFNEILNNAVSNCSLFINHNCKFDLHWLRNRGFRLPSGCRVWDTQLAEFILSGQTNSFVSLNDLADLYGLPTKLDAVADYWEKGISTEDIPPDVLEEYNNYDVVLTYQVYEKQLTDPRMTPELKKLILLDGLDLLVLQEMEYNGLKYDCEASLTEADKLKKELVGIEEELKKYAGDINFDSGDQLSCFIYGGSFEVKTATPEERVYKSGPNKGQTYTMNRWETRTITLPGYFKPLPRTELKKSKPGAMFYSTGDDILKQLKSRTKVQKRILELIARRAYIVKLVGTYLEALPKLIEEMHWGEYLHPQYNQCQARTGRLSSSRPNAQNFPEEVGKYMVSEYAD